MSTPNTDPRAKPDPRPNPEPRPGTESRRPLRTSDLAAAGSIPDDAQQDAPRQRRSPTEPQAAAESVTAETRPSRFETPDSGSLEALFAPDVAAQFRNRWTDVQSGFVDDPRRAVAAGDELVAQVMQSLAESFAHERKRLETELSETGEASTETLRVGLRRYRSFFERLLAL